MRCFIILLFFFTASLNAQSRFQSVKDHIMRMAVISAKDITSEVSSNHIKLNNQLNQIKEKGGHLFILIRGEITKFSELETGCIITIKGDYFKDISLYSALDEDVFTYSVGEEIYAFASPYRLQEYDSIYDIAILSKTKLELAEKIIAIVNGIINYPEKYTLLKHLLDVKSSIYKHIGMDSSISAFVKYFNLENAH